ncbi:alpha/beta-hydrolase [Hyphopichia burtonii NRRL Y-1933]|uniref:Alpha/beta-hydrolase n=1 Tax=Hyphopichia burtonii NRRL Y-1933 TaxID=984485 RepID=A0A1E4RCH8_9ASCO|nr:alpha/beta-hydrolase [Hyphopichia burtonii NRRL Y-1933]ODV64950.1 alpha/beta-hydrolase [Hyphopichia burtonii NRRL Y-1933]
MYIPLLGRLSILEWPIIIISFLLTWIEYLISVITGILPSPIINLCTNTIQQIYKFTSNPIDLISSTVTSSSNVQEVKYKYLDSNSHPELTREKYELMTDLLNSSSIQEMCQLFGYDVENEIVRTDDGYFLTIQRILKNGQANKGGRVIYLHHGLLMNSEIWVTMLDKHSNLPFILYDLGYDVWLGNNRGNKYSQKHLYYKLNSEKFWDFSIDEFALFDIPNTINYILNTTKAEKLTYIGFSQGTAQAFASVSVNPDLNDKIDQIIAISPATTPHGLYSKFLDLLLKSSPNFVFLLFSRKVLMPSVILWGKIMYPPLFDTFIDISNYLLFNWKSINISKIQKLSSYAHLYSTTSVKTVAHWFQIILSKNFQMYHDSNSNFSGLNPISYPLQNIKVPINLLYGDCDSLVDINVMKNQLPAKYTKCQVVPNHEHLDNLWGFDVNKVVFNHVLHYLGHSLPDSIVENSEKTYLKTLDDIESVAEADAISQDLERHIYPGATRF